MHMFVYYFLHLDLTFDEARLILGSSLEDLSETADIAYREGEALLMKAGPETWQWAKTVRVNFGDPILVDEEFVIPLSWEAAGATALFPKMEAQLRLASIGPSITQLSLEGSYQPPLGSVGRILDRAFMHRLAEATVKHFVDQIGYAMTYGLPDLDHASAE